MSAAGVFGWSPARDDIDNASSPASHMFTFRLEARRRGHDDWSPVDKPSPTSSASSVLDFNMDDAPPLPARKGEPGYIPRPRNAFVIFRCDFCKEHIALSKKENAQLTSKTGKTLSKIASEAWNALPQYEKEEYIERANKEKADHARRFPHYKYRPVRGGRGGPHRTARRAHVVRSRAVYDDDDDEDYSPSRRKRAAKRAASVRKSSPSSPASSPSPPPVAALELPTASRPRPSSWMSAMPVHSAHYTIPDGVDIQKSEPLFLDLPQQKGPSPALRLASSSPPAPSQAVPPLEAVAASLINWSGVQQPLECASTTQGATSYSGMVACDSMTPSTGSSYPSPYMAAHNGATQVSTSGTLSPAHPYPSPSYDGQNTYGPTPASTFSHATSYEAPAPYADQVVYADQGAFASTSYPSYTESLSTPGTVHPAYLHAPLDDSARVAMQNYEEGLMSHGIAHGDASQYYIPAAFEEASASYGYAVVPSAPDAEPVTWSVPHDASGAPASLPFDVAGYAAASTGPYHTFTYGDAYNHGHM